MPTGKDSPYTNKHSPMPNPGTQQEATEPDSTAPASTTPASGKARQPLDNRSLREQYLFTQADNLIAHERQKERRKQKTTKQRHWFYSFAWVFFLLLVGYLIFS